MSFLNGNISGVRWLACDAKILSRETFLFVFFFCEKLLHLEMGESKTPVWLFIPNLIGLVSLYCLPPILFFPIPSHICISGYARVVFGIWAFYYSFTDYQCFFFMYGLSAALDMADGYAARYFDQCLISLPCFFAGFIPELNFLFS